MPKLRLKYILEVDDKPVLTSTVSSDECTDIKDFFLRTFTAYRMLDREATARIHAGQVAFLSEPDNAR